MLNNEDFVWRMKQHEGCVKGKIRFPFIIGPKSSFITISTRLTPQIPELRKEVKRPALLFLAADRGKSPQFYIYFYQFFVIVPKTLIGTVDTSGVCLYGLVKWDIFGTVSS